MCSFGGLNRGTAPPDPGLPAIGGQSALSRAADAADSLLLRAGVAGRKPRRARRRARARCNSSAIWTVFSAAPLSRLSPTTKKFRLCGSPRSARTRPTNVLVAAGGLQRRRRVLDDEVRERLERRERLAEVDLALGSSRGPATAWPTITGTRTQVGDDGELRAARGSCGSRSGASSPRRCSRSSPSVPSSGTTL